MVISIHYQKRKNTPLFQKFQSNRSINLSHVQNYLPIYNRFFSLNNTNWNSINLNHSFALHDIKENKMNNNNDAPIFNCKVKHAFNEDDIQNQKVFIKMAPLLDPFKYLVGKYTNFTSEQLFSLPTFDKSVVVHPKLEDCHNSSYVDGFFSYITSQALNQHKFIHGLDYYGSFLAIKKNYKINVIDDIDYLVKTDFFVQQQGVLFHVEDYSHLQLDSNESSAPRQLKPLQISTSLKSGISVEAMDDSIFEDVFETMPADEVTAITTTDNANLMMTLDDMKNNGVDLLDITESTCFDATFAKHSPSNNTLHSEDTCSSRTSHTESEEDADEDYNEEEEKDGDNNNGDDDNGDDDNGDENGDNDDDDNYSSSVEEEALFLTFPQFPVQVICMENCENTLDYLIMNDLLHNENEWFSALMQIIMILLTYQKMFSFTHNDLHTNNIMYVSTKIPFLYYTYQKKTYKVPTFGKIFKLIDFGRAIYKFEGKTFCSDSFKSGGDAATQYNTEPFFNDKKPRIEPNFSFDLCRLGCSIFDYVVDDFESSKQLSTCSPLVRLIVEWCMDDNGINILYKTNGEERYPDFKLYKIIARYVHKHTPQEQLERPEFHKFLISGKIPKNEYVINIDEYPCYV
jgi:hypothetical protein